MRMRWPWSVLSLWLILIISVIAQEGDNNCPQNMFQQCHEDLEEKFVCVYSRNKDGIMKLNGSFSLDMDNPEFPDSRLPLNISCNVSQETHLYIDWDTSDFPDTAEYSICYRLSNESDILQSNKQHVEGPVYHTLIPKQSESIIVQLNVSFQDICFIQKQEWRICDIEKPSPPKITNATFQSGGLYLQWNLPKCAVTNPFCFQYELRINGEVRVLEEKQSYTEPSVDTTQTYKIQMRAKNKCCDSLFWSDWTSVLEVGSPVTSLTDLHIGGIIAIALGLPMILLAILLLCKFQRVFEKLFPPIPGPSIKIKGLLEKDITSQIMSHKCVEEVTEVEVKEDDLEEEEEETEEERW